MLQMLCKVPRQVTIALSGGVDSIVACDFLSKNHDVQCVFVDHGTVNSAQARVFVEEFCDQRNLPLRVSEIDPVCPAGVSQEEHWRNERYKVLESIEGSVVTGHNLNDCMETWIFTSLHGQGKLIPRQRNNVIRPFLPTPKSEFINWAQRRGLQWCEDTSNTDTAYMRNFIRHELMPKALHVNPGLAKVIKRKVVMDDPGA